MYYSVIRLSMTKNTFIDRKSITKNMNKLFVLLVIFSMTSCAEQQISRTLKNFRASTITIPEDLQKIHRRSQTTIEGCDTGTPVMIIYHDSLECSSCRTSPFQKTGDSTVFSSTVPDTLFSSVIRQQVTRCGHYF